MNNKNLNIVVVVAVIAIAVIVGVTRAGAVPGAGKSGNPPGVEPATTFQDLVDCCQNQATVAEYQDNAATNQVMGTCTKMGIETFRTGGLTALQGYINSTCGGACTSDADCDDGNPCTDDVCTTGPRAGCITGTAVDGTSCQIDGQLGVCEGATCVPSGETCITFTECENGGWDVTRTTGCESGLACGIAAEFTCICAE